MTADRFLDRPTVAVPETEPALADHLEYYEDLLLHVFMAQVRRLCETAWAERDDDLLRRCLPVLNEGLLDGDDEVNNAVAVSFVEDICWWDPSTDEATSDG